MDLLKIINNAALLTLTPKQQIAFEAAKWLYSSIPRRDGKTHLIMTSLIIKSVSENCWVDILDHEKTGTSIRLDSLNSLNTAVYSINKELEKHGYTIVISVKATENMFKAEVIRYESKKSIS